MRWRVLRAEYHSSIPRWQSTKNAAICGGPNTPCTWSNTLSCPPFSRSSADEVFVSKRQSTRPFCARALRQQGGSPSIRCTVVRVSRACRALRAVLASLAVMGSRVDKGRSSQAEYPGSLSSLSSGVLTIGTVSRAACVDLGTFPHFRLTRCYTLTVCSSLGSSLACSRFPLGRCFARGLTRYGLARYGFARGLARCRLAR